MLNFNNTYIFKISIVNCTVCVCVWYPCVYLPVLMPRYKFSITTQNPGRESECPAARADNLQRNYKIVLQRVDTTTHTQEPGGKLYGQGGG